MHLIQFSTTKLVVLFIYPEFNSYVFEKCLQRVGLSKKIPKIFLRSTFYTHLFQISIENVVLENNVCYADVNFKLEDIKLAQLNFNIELRGAVFEAYVLS